MGRMIVGFGLWAPAMASSMMVPMYENQYWDDKYFVDAGEWDQYEIDYSAIHPLIEDHLQNTKVQRALVPGCGTSRIPQQIIESIDGSRSIGVDFSNIVVDAMRARIPQEYTRQSIVSYVHMDVLEMGQSFGSETMDLIIDKSMLDTLRLRPDHTNVVSSYLETLHFLLSQTGLAVFITPSRPQEIIPILHDHPFNGWNCGDIQGIPRSRPLRHAAKFDILDASRSNITVYICRRVQDGENNKDVVFNHVAANAAFGNRGERDARKLKADIRAEEEARLYREKIGRMKQEVKDMEDARAIREAERKAEDEAKLLVMQRETEAIRQRAAAEAAEAAEAADAQLQRQQTDEIEAAAAAAAALEEQAANDQKKKMSKGDVHCVGFWDDWSSCDESTCTQERLFSIMSRQKGNGRSCEAGNNEQQIRVCDAPCAAEVEVRPAETAPAEKTPPETPPAAEPATPAAEPATPAAPPQPEFRIDPADGNAYPVEEFMVYYPHDWQARWEAAQVWPPKPADPPVQEAAPVQEEPVAEPEPVVETPPPNKVKDVHCFGTWSDWTNCQADCVMRRTLTHNNIQQGNGDHCNHEHGYTQTMECLHGACKPNCIGEWSAWSDCSPAAQPGECGAQSRSYSVIRKKQRSSDKDCENEAGAMEMQECGCIPEEPVADINPNAVDCEAFWTERTACSESCTQELEYTILTPAEEEGTACEHEDEHVVVQACTGGSCTKTEL